MQKVLGVAVNQENEVEEVLHKFQLQKAVLICAWIQRFAHNSLHTRGTPCILESLTAEETNSQRVFWEKHTLKSCDIERDMNHYRGTKPTAKPGRNIGMSGPNTRGVSSLHTRNQHACSPSSRRSIPRNIARGNGANHGQGACSSLDSKIETASDKG